MTVRLALIGAGAAGRTHMAAIAVTPGAELVAIADPAPAQPAHGAPVFADMGEMLDRVRPDGVIIATPTHLHGAHALAAIAARVPALIEKPLAATLAQGQELTAATRASGVPVLVGHHRRYYAVLERARDIVRSGGLGKLVAVAGQWCVRKADSYFAPDWRQRREAGPVLTNLVHEVDALRFVCGEIASLAADVARVRGFDKEDAASLSIRFTSGALGSFVISDATPSPWSWEFATGENPAFPRSGHNVWRLMGTAGSLEFPNLRLWRHASADGDWRHPVGGQDLAVPLNDAFVAQCAHFCAVIQGQDSPRITLEDAMNTLRATLAVHSAAASGRKIVLIPA